MSCSIVTALLQSEVALTASCGHVSYSLNSLQGGYIGTYIGDYYRGY